MALSDLGTETLECRFEERNCPLKLSGAGVDRSEVGAADEPVRVIGAKLRFPLPEVSLEHLDGVGRAAEVAVGHGEVVAAIAASSGVGSAPTS